MSIYTQCHFYILCKDIHGTLDVMISYTGKICVAYRGCTFLVVLL